jgi:hypothetical protein
MKKLLLALLTLSTLAGCQKKRESPPCYAGTLLGTTCDNGYLIQVDTMAHADLGKGLVFQGDGGPALSGPVLPQGRYANVIIVYHAPGQSALYSALQRGQKLYMNLGPGPTEIPLYCPPSAATYDAPKFTLTDYSGTSCPEFFPD